MRVWVFCAAGVACALGVGCGGDGGGGVIFEPTLTQPSVTSTTSSTADSGDSTDGGGSESSRGLDFAEWACTNYGYADYCVAAWPDSAPGTVQYFIECFQGDDRCLYGERGGDRRTCRGPVGQGCSMCSEAHGRCFVPWAD